MFRSIRHGLKPEAANSPVSRGHKMGPRFCVFRPLDAGRFSASGFNPWQMPLCAAVCAALLAAAGCHHDSPPPPNPAAPPVAATPAPRDKAVVYVINRKAKGDGDALIPHTVALRHPESPVSDSVNALISAEGSPIPAGTALRGASIDNGLATLDFSRSPINETGGENAQGEALTALARTLGQFPEIRQYQIEVKGQPVKSLGEEGALDGPIDVIRPDAVQQAKGNAP